MFLYDCYPGWVRTGLLLGNFHCRGVLLMSTIVWQGPTVLAVGVGSGCLGIFFVSSDQSITFVGAGNTHGWY